MDDAKPPVPKWLSDPYHDKYKRSKKHEQRLATRFGGRRLPQSGAKQLSPHVIAAQTDLGVEPPRVTLNGDLSIPDFWVEHKRTEKESLSIKKEWWEKVVIGANTAGQQPALFLTFDCRGPYQKPIDLVVLPIEVFERLMKLAKGDADE